MNRLFLLLLLCPSLNPAFAQGNATDRVQTGWQHPVQKDSSQVNMLNALSYQYQWMDFERSLQYAEEAFNMADAISYRAGMATACYRQAQCYWSLGDSERAIEKGLVAIAIAEQEGLADVVAEADRILAISYRDQQEIGKALTYIRQAERLALKNNNWDLLARVYNVAGIIDNGRLLRDSAIMYYQKSLQISSEHPVTQFHIPPVLANMGEIYLEENPETALKYFNRALASAIETKHKSAEAGIVADIGRAHILLKNYKEADRYLHMSLKLSHELGLKRVTRHAYYALADLKLREEKTAEAFNFMKAYYDVRDSLLNGATTRQIVELETRFEKEKQEQKIKLLEQEHQIQNLWKNALVVGSLLLMVVFILIYRLQKLQATKASQLLEAQQVLTDKLKETDHLKSRFMATISHEFRTPLSLILGPVNEQLRNPGLSPTERKNLVMTQRNANRLLDLVNQLLDLSKLEAGKMELDVRPGNLSAFLQLLTASFDSLAEHRQLTFMKNISQINDAVGYDEDKIEKIVTNILFNAFKFTPAGGQVAFSLHVVTQKREMVISVADTGKGIPADEKKNIFSPFYQFKHPDEDGQVGTGLGLSLVNELVKLYGGKINLTSELNQGTCVTIVLPLFDVTHHYSESPSVKPIQIPDETQPLTDIVVDDELVTILVVEDNADLRDFIASGFTNQYNVLLAVDGEDGLAKAKENIPDIIVSDVMMPNMDGLEFTRHIKQNECTSHIPTILLTAKAEEQSRIEGLKIGADDYLPKPFSLEELQLRVNNVLALRKRYAAKLKADLMLEKETEAEPTEPSLDEKFMVKVKSIIEENIGHPSFNVEMLASEMNLSRAQLFRKIKALTNTAPSELINDLRLHRAAQLIRAKADNVAQIAYAVGFSEQSYFAKRFRKKYGVSPSEYAR